MTMRKFIRRNRAAIDTCIKGNGAKVGNDQEREDWILNHEPLYLWARSAGVRV
jgi:hypothetical protein